VFTEIQTPGSTQAENTVKPACYGFGNSPIRPQHSGVLPSRRSSARLSGLANVPSVNSRLLLPVRNRFEEGQRLPLADAVVPRVWTAELRLLEVHHKFPALVASPVVISPAGARCPQGHGRVRAYRSPNVRWAHTCTVDPTPRDRRPNRPSPSRIGGHSRRRSLASGENAGHARCCRSPASLSRRGPSGLESACATPQSRILRARSWAPTFPQALIQRAPTRWPPVVPSELPRPQVNLANVRPLRLAVVGFAEPRLVDVHSRLVGHRDVARNALLLAVRSGSDPPLGGDPSLHAKAEVLRAAAERGQRSSSINLVTGSGFPGATASVA
jgi:hypothetical protein